MKKINYKLIAEALDFYTTHKNVTEFSRKYPNIIKLINCSRAYYNIDYRINHVFIEPDTWRKKYNFTELNILINQLDNAEIKSIIRSAENGIKMNNEIIEIIKKIGQYGIKKLLNFSKELINTKYFEIGLDNYLYNYGYDPNNKKLWNDLIDDIISMCDKPYTYERKFY